jgi:hypothetical protein
MHAVANPVRNRATMPTIYVRAHETIVAAVDRYRGQTGYAGGCFIKFSRSRTLKAQAA